MHSLFLFSGMSYASRSVLDIDILVNLPLVGGAKLVVYDHETKYDTPPAHAPSSDMVGH
jgi:hypothetical protein